LELKYPNRLKSWVGGYEYCTDLYEEHLLLACELMKEEILCSSSSLKLTTAVRRYLSLAIVLTRGVPKNLTSTAVH
jgi:hypothetical protein